MLINFMSSAWYPQNKRELSKVLDEFMKGVSDNKFSDGWVGGKTIKPKDVHGLVVPHAGYQFSGAIAGKAFALLKNQKNNKAIVLAPSHYAAFRGLMSLSEIKTPLGEIKIIPNNYKKINYEHAIDNQIPFLQKLGFKEVLPLVVGQINKEEAKKIAGDLVKYKDIIFIISTDLSHFLSYDEAVKNDKKSVKIIENLDIEKFSELDACGHFPLLIMMYLCELKNWKPKLIEYKNSGDVIGDKSQVVGYANFWF